MVLVLLAIGFAAGVITALSPCILPVLPIVFAGSAAGQTRRRSIAIIAGLVVSFTTFTLTAGALLSALGLPQDFLRNLAIGMLFVIAAMLVFPPFAVLVERSFAVLSSRRTGNSEHGAFLLGVSLGLVFVPCAGPVLATISVLSAEHHLSLATVLLTLSYALGAASILLIVALGSQRVTRPLRTHGVAFRRAMGLVIAAAALAIVFNVDQDLQTRLGSYSSLLQQHVEDTSYARVRLGDLRGATSLRVPSGESAAGALPDYGTAPEFRGIERWLNTPGDRPFSIAGLRGRVVLLDFWTYSCINCLRTLPHLKAWDSSYRDVGLTIVGVHSPEFAFERVPDNVRSAVHRLGIRYPVALDNDFATWRAYSNQYWPAKYLIDREGRLRFYHFGEGEYEDTERRIRALLGETVTAKPTSVDEEPQYRVQTPESYLGYERLGRFANGNVAPDVERMYTFPREELPVDALGYAGRWKVEGERSVAGDDARLKLRFQAQDVFLVLEGEGAVEVFVDGRRGPTVTVSGLPRLYTLARFARFRRGLMELHFSPGVAAYAFTFG